MSSKSFRPSESGVTLVELLVVIAIIAVVATLALMSGGSANQQLKRQNVAVELKTAFERARFDSVKRRAATTDIQAKVTVSTSSFTLTTDRNLDGVLTTSDDVITTLPAGIVMANYPGRDAITTPQEVKFNMRGEAPTSPAPQFYICNVTCSSPDSSNANVLIVTPTGTVNLLPGGAEMPDFGVPSHTNVPTNTGVNPDAVL